MSEFETGGGFDRETTQIYLKRVLPGNIDSVRARLAAALERVGYVVVDEEPVLGGRKGAKGWSVWYGSADVLDYATTLTIRLKAVGPRSTRATFDYTIAHPWLSQKDKQVLAREVEAVVALATVRTADKLCMSCGTEAVDDSRFCRRCGTPMTADQTTLDLLRITAETRAAHTSVAIGQVLQIMSTVLLSVALVLGASAAIGGPAFLRLVVAGMIVGSVALIFTRLANLRLGRALPASPWASAVSMAQPNLSSEEPAALPPTPASVSVTEGTTELFTAPTGEAVPIARVNETPTR